MRKDFEQFMHCLAEASNEQQNVTAAIREAKEDYDNALAKVEQETALLMFNSFAGPNQSRSNLNHAQAMLESARAKHVEALEGADELSRLRKPYLLRVQNAVIAGLDNVLSQAGA
jgi:hypothetical protein